MTVGLPVLLFEGALVELLEAIVADEMLGVELALHGGDAATRNGLVAACAQRASHRVVVDLAVRHAVVVKEVALVEWHSTVCTHEAFRMPLCIQRRDKVLHDGPIATTASRSKHVKVVIATVGPAVLLVKAVLSKRLAALGTEEVFRVPGLVQGCYAPVFDGPVAVGTFGGKQTVVILLAVSLAISLKERLGAKLLVALGAHKVLRMPRLAQRCYDLSCDGLLACSTRSLRHGLHPVPRHIRVEMAQH